MTCTVCGAAIAENATPFLLGSHVLCGSCHAKASARVDQRSGGGDAMIVMRFILVLAGLALLLWGGRDVSKAMTLTAEIEHDGALARGLAAGLVNLLLWRGVAMAALGLIALGVSAALGVASRIERLLRRARLDEGA
ncbi:MAG: hypothetical protein WBD40_01390 [Tepidisphaeraceae bacterium]